MPPSLKDYIPGCWYLQSAGKLCYVILYHILSSWKRKQVYFMKAEIISTGKELVTGALVDQNAAYLANLLEENGIAVIRHQVVGDEIEELVQVFQEAGKRADMVIVTGGLGPTQDDRTRDAAALAKGVSLIENPEARKKLEDLFARFNTPPGPSNLRQAMFPETAEMIPNPKGTAPGFFMEISGAVFYFLPGVPFEMKPMFLESVLPGIQEKTGIRKVKRIHTITTFGMTEAQVDEALSDFSIQVPGIAIGLCSVFPVIQVKLYAMEEKDNDMKPSMESAKEYVAEKLGQRVVSMEGKSLEEKLGELLVFKGATLAFAESCTGGLMAHMITSVPGSSDYFLFSGITYSNQAKIRVLGVDEKTIETHGAVHPETAKEMAMGAKKTGNADYAAATSGIAGPGGGTPDKPVGTVAIGIATPAKAYGRMIRFPFPDREMNKTIFACAALDILRREILNGN